MLPRVLTRGTDNAARLLDDIAHRVMDQAPAWRLVGQDVLHLQQRWWASKGAGSWPADKEATKERDKRADKRKARSPELMVASGDLRDAATSESSVHPGTDHLLLTLGSDVHYALTLAKAGREPLGMPDDHQITGYAQAVADFVLTGTPRHA